MTKMNPVIIIPAFQPSRELLDLVSGLTQDAIQKVIVVNDGSTGSPLKIITQLETFSKQVDVIHHAANLGKGQALKTGFNHFLVNYTENSIGVVTADADGQHSVKDILAISQNLKQNPSILYIGSRKLDKNVPIRSKLGNRLTSFVFKLVTGKSLQDTQSGLRGIPREFLFELLHSNENGYDFELDMLIQSIKHHWIIKEIPIETIYLSENKSSHFNVLRDSLKIYFVFIRFLALSLTTAVIDYSVFSFWFWQTNDIFRSVVLARLIAGLFQFTLGKYWVFKSQGKFLYELIKYILLVIGLMLLSFSIINPLVMDFNINPYLSKILAEATIFLLSFTAQNLLVYSKEIKTETKTNWDVYYDSPFKASVISRKFTQRKLHNLVSTFGSSNLSQIIELGGGNSSFFAGLREKFPQATYTIIDNNKHGLQLFQKEHEADDRIHLICEDVLTLNSSTEKFADLVFSIGLIEHFDHAGTASAIKSHFSNVKPGGIVIITFPTPTWLYVVARRITELAGKWKFPDERPLTMKEVIQEAQKYGQIIHTSINWPIIFTQGILLIRAM